MISEIFSVRLKELRKSNNLTLEQLGDNVGLKKNSLSGIENTKEHISFDKAVAIADYFNVSLDYLVGRSDLPDIVTKDDNGNLLIVEAMEPHKDLEEGE